MDGSSEPSTSEEEDYLPKKRKTKNVSFWDSFTDEWEDADQPTFRPRKDKTTFVKQFSMPMNFVKATSSDEPHEEQRVSQESAVPSKDAEESKVVKQDQASDSSIEDIPGGGFHRKRLKPHTELPYSFGVVRKVKNEHHFGYADQQSMNTSSGNTLKPQTNKLGDWEKYTKGFGSKMLQKMGFTGRLGANEQGLEKPLEPYVRPKNLGLAADGFVEKKDLQSNKTEELFRRKDKVLELKDQKIVSSLKKRWKKPKEIASSHSTMEEDKDRRDVIVDMRGPTSRQLNSIADATVLQQERQPNKPSFLPELQYNIKVLKDLSKLSSEQSLEQVRMEEKRKISLEQGLERFNQQVKKRNRTASMLKALIDSVQRMEESESLYEILKIAKELVVYYQEDYPLDKIFDAMTACAYRLLNDYFNRNPFMISLEQDMEWTPAISELALLLGGRDESKSYSQLIWNTVILRIKRHLSSSKFDVQNSGSLVGFIESWQKVVPNDMLENLVSDIIYPRLRKEAEHEWDPFQSLMPHHWLFPWLPLLGRRHMAHLFDGVVKKIGQWLKHWHPSDSSAIGAIKPWLQIARKSSISKLLHRYVIPRLETAMKEELVIEIPNDESDSSNDSVFFWIMDWYGILENESLAIILLRNFFPVWLKTLLQWLSVEEEVDWERVSLWYEKWKKRFPSELLKMSNIRRAFDIALDLMNRSMHQQNMSCIDIDQLLQWTKGSPFCMKDTRQPEESVAEHWMITDTVHTNFKDLVSYFAERNGITLLPYIKNHKQQNHTEMTYLFGEIPIRLDHQQQVIYCQVDKKQDWQPVTLEQLLKVVQEKRQSR
eukprot:jgi/Galph1/5294/GphlegSOOS_G3903.1